MMANQKNQNQANKNYVYERPWLYPKQLKAIFDPRRYSVIEATTKAGKTVGCMVWLAEQAMNGARGKNYWWVAPIFTQAKIAFRRLKLGLPKHIYKPNETELTITLANGAVIWFKGADKPDSLYGEDVFAAVIDEASRCKEDAWYAIRSTLTATRGHVRIIGNVKGRRNWAYKLARKAEAGAPNMGYHKITAKDAVAGGILNEQEIQDAKEQLPAQVFKELYEAEPSDDEGNPFGYSAIEKCIKPLSNNEPICFGVDLAKSTDYTVIIGLDELGCVCFYDRFQMPWPLTIERVFAATRGVSTLVDSTGVGDPVLEELQQKGGDYEGFKFSASSKQQIMEGLAVAIQQQKTSFPDSKLLSDCQIVNELNEFEYEYTRTGVRYSAPPGLHDDCVCALALAVSKFNNRIGFLEYYKQKFEKTNNEKTS